MFFEELHIERDFTNKDDIEAFHKSNSSFISSLEENKIKEEILAYFCEKIKEETNCTNLIQAWKLYQEINYEK